MKSNSSPYRRYCKQLEETPFLPYFASHMLLVCLVHEIANAIPVILLRFAIHFMHQTNNMNSRSWHSSNNKRFQEKWSRGTLRKGGYYVIWYLPPQLVEIHNNSYFGLCNSSDKIITWSKTLGTSYTGRAITCHRTPNHKYPPPSALPDTSRTI